MNAETKPWVDEGGYIETFDPVVAGEILSYASMGLSAPRCAELSRVRPDTLVRWMQENEAFEADFKQASAMLALLAASTLQTMRNISMNATAANMCLALMSAESDYQQAARDVLVTISDA